MFSLHAGGFFLGGGVIHALRYPASSAYIHLVTIIVFHLENN